MTDYEPVEIRGYFRAYSHLPIWEVTDFTERTHPISTKGPT